jgi:heme-degrading monooxygenase HmoA
MSSRVMYIVSCRLPVKFEQQWNRWHNEEHIPMVLSQPGFMNVRKFRCLSNNKQEVEYFVLYELRNQAAYDNYVKSEEGARLRQHYLDAYGTKTKIVRWAMCETFTLAK